MDVKLSNLNFRLKVIEKKITNWSGQARLHDSKNKTKEKETTPRTFSYNVLLLAHIKFYVVEAVFPDGNQ